MLRELQERFAAGIWREAPEVLSRIAPGRFGADRHLQVYRNNVFVSLTGALSAIYPVVEKLVGAEFFGFAAHAYIRQTPPRSGNLHDFGERYAGFLAGFKPAQALAYLPDVARLEWAWHRAFHAADASPLAPERLAGVPPTRHGALRFRLHPSVHLLSSEYPILRIWQVNQDKAADGPPVDLAEGGVKLLVWRQGLEVLIRALSPGEYVLLESFAEGSSFDDASAAALKAEPHFDLVSEMLGLVRQGTIVDFYLSRKGGCPCPS